MGYVMPGMLTHMPGICHKHLVRNNSDRGLARENGGMP
jgi:hypothetical protein